MNKSLNKLTKTNDLIDKNVYTTEKSFFIKIL